MIQYSICLNYDRIQKKKSFVAAGGGWQSITANQVAMKNACITITTVVWSNKRKERKRKFMWEEKSPIKDFSFTETGSI